MRRSPLLGVTRTPGLACLVLGALLCAFLASRCTAQVSAPGNISAPPLRPAPLIFPDCPFPPSPPPLPSPPPPSLNPFCNPLTFPTLQIISLLQFYYTTQGDTWLDSTGWPSLNASDIEVLLETYDIPTPDIEDPDWLPAPMQKFQRWSNVSWNCSDLSDGQADSMLPEYCCWFGVTCCQRNFCLLPEILDSGLTCSCVPGTVTLINLRYNNLTGGLHHRTPNITLEMVGGLRCSLTHVQLQMNAIGGSIPEHIHVLDQLEVIGLGNNSLTGTIPDIIIKIRSLRRLELTNNLLSGTIPLGLCVGSAVPLSRPGSETQVPRAEYTLPIGKQNLTDLLIAGNRLSGDIPPDCLSMVFLDANSNNLSGAIDQILFYPELHILELSNNKIGGTLPELGQWSQVLTELNLAFNLIHGPVHVSEVDLMYLSSMDLQSNYLNGTLPASLFLFSAQLTSLNLRGLCGDNTQEQDCITGTLPSTMANATKLALLDLSSNCLFGSIPDVVVEGLAGAIVTVAGNLLSCCGFQFNGSCNVQSYQVYDFNNYPLLPSGLFFSDHVYRPYENSAAVGPQTLSIEAPNSGLLICPIISDIHFQTNWNLAPSYHGFRNCTCEQGYTLDIFISLGQVQYRCTQNTSTWFDTYPWVVIFIVIGGLSILSILIWLLLFRGTQKAYLYHAFLNMRKRIKGIPTKGAVTLVFVDMEEYEGLVENMPSQMDIIMRLVNSSLRKSKRTNMGFTFEQDMCSHCFVFHEAFDAAKFCLQAQLLMLRQPWPKALLQHCMRQSQSMPMAHGLQPSEKASFQVARNVVSKFFTRSDVSQPAHIGPGPCPGSSSAQTGPGPGRSSLEAGFPMESTTVEEAKQYQFHGPGLRMGISSGKVEEGVQLKGSNMYKMAKVMCEAACGGEVLLDGPSFQQIKEKMEELGVVTHAGLDSSKLAQSTALQRCSWFPWFRTPEMSTPDSEALLLDMGLYQYNEEPSLSVVLDTMASKALGKIHTSSPYGGRKSSKVSRGSWWEKLLHGLHLNSLVHAPTTTLIVGDVTHLHLYQLLTPKLLGRAKVFGNHLGLSKEWTMLDKPYFCAPGSAEAIMGPTDPSPSIEIPDMTMAFCMVDGAKQYSMRHRKDTHALHISCMIAILSTLRYARGGYLVRQQEGDLKYMVAFCKPQDAIAWCVLAQECLMYMNWPASALQFWKEQKDARGAFIFRGPRFKMGIYEGSPRSILPDHLGRADYFGDSINMAARYMDAGAHGGQLVCENHLALQAFAAWSTDDVEAPLNSTQQAPFMQGHAKSYKQSVVLPSVSEDEPVPGKQDLTDEHSSSDVPGNKAVGTGIGIATPPGSVPATPSGAKVTTPLGSVPATPSGAKVTTPLGSVPATPSRAKPTTPLGSVPATPSGTKLETPGRLTGHLHNGASDLSFGSPQFQAPKGASNASKPPLAKDRPRPIVGASNASKPPLAKPPKDVPRPLSTASSPVTPQDSENPSVKSNRSSSKSDALCSSDSSSAEQLATWSLNQGLAPRSTLVVGTPTTTTTMRAERLGYFRFKGAADKVKLVSIYHDALAQRMYTQQAPQGKGNRLSRATGLVASVLVELPAIVDAFKDKLLETEVSRANTPFVMIAESGNSSPGT